LRCWGGGDIVTKIEMIIWNDKSIIQDPGKIILTMT
jgi:hypothetical protein